MLCAECCNIAPKRGVPFSAGGGSALYGARPAIDADGLGKGRDIERAGLHTRDDCTDGRRPVEPFAMQSIRQEHSVQPALDVIAAGHRRHDFKHHGRPSLQAAHAIFDQRGAADLDRTVLPDRPHEIDDAAHAAASSAPSTGGT